MLTDFGISRLVKDGITVTGTTSFQFSVNWVAIELVKPSDTDGAADPNQSHTMKSDIWALGMVFYASVHDDSSGLSTEQIFRKF